jgi:ribose-phosphate pyrophosphokinase
MDRSTMAVFTGNANQQLALEIARHLMVPLGKASVSRFSDSEITVELLEIVRGRDIFIVQPTCSPANDHLMELLVMVDACRRASAARITAVIPYFGYARQDRRPRAMRVPITAKLIANMIASAGVDRVLTVDLHSDQIQGFFDIPVDNVYASPVLLGDAWKQMYENLVVVSPDVGGVVRARALAKRLDDADLAIIDKRRPRANESEVMNIIGEVEGKSCILIDDLVDTAGTLCHAAEALKEAGAKKVAAYITHAVLSGPAIERITKSDLDELVVTDTIPLRDAARACPKIRQLSVAGLLAETMRRIRDEESVGSLYID